MIKGYQWVFRPLLGNRCRFYPSCSEYTFDAIQIHGLASGSWLGAKRIIRCHPWCQGGVDPVPGKLNRATSSATTIVD